MRFVWPWLMLSIINLQLAHAQIKEHHNLSVIKSIDDLDLPPAYNEASERSLPPKIFDLDRFTPLSDERVRDLFNELERHPRARMKVAGGKCSYRRSYIQSYLRKRSISSGRLLLECPSKNGRLRLKDQVTGRRYTFSNFHDTNIVSVRTNSGTGYHVMDVQFQDRPVSLSSYLGQIEASQKIKPLRNRSTGDKGYCYWSIR